MKHVVMFSGKRSSGYLCQLISNISPKTDVEYLYVDQGDKLSAGYDFIKKVDSTYKLNLTCITLEDGDYEIFTSSELSPSKDKVRLDNSKVTELIAEYLSDTYGNTKYLLWSGETVDERSKSGDQDMTRCLTDLSDYTQEDVKNWWQGNEFDLEDSGTAQVTSKDLEVLTEKQKLQQRQSLPLEAKIQMTKARVRQWYDHYEGKVYCSFSGGKDSNVLAHIIRSMKKPYCEIPLVFVNTGLEFPEVLSHVRGLKDLGWNIEQIKPLRTFKDIWGNDGIPLVSKRVARQVRIARGELGGEQSRNLVLNGITKRGVPTKSQWKMSEKWKYLIPADVKISDTCCDYLKKKPFILYEKQTGLKVMTAMMADEGGTREMIKRCNMFDGSRPKSSPMLFWKESDVWDYVKEFNVDLAETYYDKEYDFEGQKVCIKGEKRTGCMFCAFGQHLVKDDLTKFQKMQVTHPRQYNVIINRMGLDKALDLVGVKYKFEIPVKMFEEKNQLDLL